ncbi:MAG: hypothetical protein RR502_01135 [Oscillospiraceae bacterium]
MFQYEFKLALRNKLIIVCIIIGILSGVPGLFSYYSDSIFMVDANQSSAVSFYQAFLYTLSFGSGTLFKIVAPLLIIPNLDSFFMDRKSGYSNFVITRSNYWQYFFSKLFSGALVAGTILVSILVFLLALCAVIFPHNMPIESYTYISDNAIRHFFVANPLKYIIIIILLNFLFATIFFSLGFGLSYFCKSRYIVMIIPFLLYLAFSMLASILSIPILSPVSLLVPYEIIGLSCTNIIAQYIALICLSISIVVYTFFRSQSEV